MIPAGSMITPLPRLCTVSGCSGPPKNSSNTERSRRERGSTSCSVPMNTTAGEVRSTTSTVASRRRFVSARDGGANERVAARASVEMLRRGRFIEGFLD